VPVIRVSSLAAEKQLMIDNRSSDSEEPGQSNQYRSLFISDLHLGTKGAQAEALLEFLREHDAETIYLVGDIVDGWRLRSSWYWPQAHNDVIQKLLRKARKGARIVYVLGNHDEFLREFCGLHFGDIEIAETTMHDAADGRRYLVMHGDAFDLVVNHARWLAFLGDWAYVAALALSTRINIVRRRLGFTYWSLSAWAKARVKNAVSFIGRFEETLAAEAKRHGVDGVICGHIHSAAMRDFGGFTYINTGDWVESCTAVVEHRDGRMEIIRWQEFSRVLNASRTPSMALPWRRAA
jgi:UDP-2,3-diacylglucosamine pyrophosphatase LpxH